jgi:beta-lactamase regulating signal transducer with metallopeptidase domain
MTGEFLNTNQVWIPLLQGSVALGLGLVGSVLLKRHAARAHHLLCWGMVAACAIPIMSLAAKHYGWGLLPAPIPASVVVSEAPIATLVNLAPLVKRVPSNEASKPLERIPKPAITAEASGVPALPPQPTPSNKDVYSVPWRATLIVTWGGVGLVLLIRLVHTFLSGGRLLRAAVPLVNTGLQQAAAQASTKLNVGIQADLRVSENVASPVIWCWGRRPVLLVQTEADACQPSPDWVGLFCHELAHWKRRDHIWGLFAECVVCLLWWHPLVWWAKRRLQHLSEHACDDWVVASGQAIPEYAESLLNLSPEARMSFLPTVIGKDKAMKERIYRIIKQHCTHPGIGRRWTLFMGLIACGMIVTTALAQPRMERPERKSGHREDREEIADQRQAFLQKRLQEVQEQIEELEHALKGEAPRDHIELRQQLRVNHLLSEVLTREMRRIERPQRGDQLQEPPRRDVGEHQVGIRKLKVLERVTHDTQAEIHELEKNGQGNSDHAHALRERLHDLHAKTEQTKQFQERRPQQREPDDRLVRTRDLADELAHQEVQARHIEGELEKLGDTHPDRRQALQSDLQKRHLHMEEIHRKLRQSDTDSLQPIDERRHELERLGDRAEEVGRNLREIGDRHPEKAEQLEMERQEIHTHMAELEQYIHAQTNDRDLDKAHQMHKRLAEQAEEIQKARHELGDRHPDKAEALERELHQIHAYMKKMESSIHDRNPNREEDMPLHERPNLEYQVQQLNGQVDRLNREMQKIQKMLQQLIEQKERQEQYR